MIEQFLLRVKAKTPPKNPLWAKIFSGAGFHSTKSDLREKGPLFRAKTGKGSGLWAAGEQRGAGEQNDSAGCGQVRQTKGGWPRPQVAG
jgi:hypothetical protein